MGIHCRACGCTYWQNQIDEYDFAAFDKPVEQRLKSLLKIVD